LKLLGLAAVAAMALTAFFGAGSASATTLCTQTETPCAAGNQYTLTQDNIIEASLEAGTTAVLKNTSGSIEDTCNTSSIKAELTNSGGAAATVAGKVTEIAFGGCTNTTSVNNAATCTFEVHNVANTDHGTLTGSGCTVGVVAFGFPCWWSAANGTHLGTVTGGSMATLDIKAVVQRVDQSSFLCPSTAIWEANYTVTKPTGGMYVEP